MNWISSLQKAIDYVEEHITEKIDYEKVAKEACSSAFHFQRIFGIMCGITLGDYIRMRRLTLAAQEIMNTDKKIIDIALDYGDDSPESFTRAFSKFHGVTPTEVRSGATITAFSRLSVKLILSGGNLMNYRIEKKPAMTLTGHKQHCSGSPTNPDVKRRETFVHWTTSRCEQRTMKTLREEPNVWYDVYTGFTDEGFDHYIAVRGTGEKRFGLETVEITESLYAVFETGRQESPDDQWLSLMKRIVSEWLPSSGYALADRPQINLVVMDPDPTKRYMEIWIPIEKE